MFSHWSLRSRLSALALGAALVTAAIGALALWGINRVADDMGALQEHRVKPLVQLDIVGRALERQRAAVLATLAATNDLMIEALEKQVAADAAQMPRTLAALRANATRIEEIAAIDRLRTMLAASRTEGLEEVLQRLRKGQFVEADAAAQARYRPQVDAASSALDALIALHVALSEQEYQAAVSLVRRQAIVTTVATLFALVAGILLAFAISRALQRALGAHEMELAQGAQRVAQGELQHRIAVVPGDDSSVAASLNTMSEEFSGIVSGVASGASHVADTAERLARSSHDLAGRASQEAASIEETAATMQQIATTVGQNHQRAERARDLAAKAAAVATNGGKAVADVAAIMDEIAASSRRIGEIVAMIDGIAFQTNILALNAAVEAARAGEHGRGFAVVAAEVRSLSQRSAGAAREIRGLVEDSAARTLAGTKLVSGAADTMRGMVASSKDVEEIVGEIANASREQSNGVAQVSRAIEQLEAVTQGNAALAERTAADAREMASQAEVLVDSVARFSLDEAKREATQVITRAARYELVTQDAAR